jgi:predicted  nucleic acid-binding Zn-ribbon protein
VREQLRALVKLAEVDDSATDIDKELKALPASLADMKGDLDRLDSLLEAERGEVKEAQTLQDAYGEQISQTNVGLSKAKAKGAKARNAREVEMAEREMETARRMIREREEEQLKLQEAIDTKEKSLVDREEKLGEFRKMYDDEAAASKIRIEELQAERSKVTVGRDDITATIEKATLRRYERVRDKYGSAVSPVIDGICQGCRVAIRPQVQLDLHAPKELFECQQCHRVLYIRESLEAPEGA